MSDVFVRVAVAAPLKEPLTYKISDSDCEKYKKGTSVVVPLGKRQAQGVVLDFCTPPTEFPAEKIKFISDVCEDRPVLPSLYLK